MALETYIPAEVTLAGRTIGDAFALVLFDPDSDEPHGALTTHNPPAEDERAGPLVVVGTRDGRRWRVTLPEIEVVRATAVGCEFNIFGRVQREVLAEAT